MVGFEKEVNRICTIFKTLKDPHVKIISHLDADGLASAAILVAAFKRAHIKFTLSVVKQIDGDIIKELEKEQITTIFLTDIGSGYLSLLNLQHKEIFILDHHKPEDFQNTSINHLNPHTLKIDGSKEISGAGVTYLFAKEFDKRNIGLAHLAIIGAIGDMQEGNGFFGLNMAILQDAIGNNKIKVTKGLRFFGANTKPIHKLLEYSDFHIPGVSGSEHGALNFLESLGIDLKEGSHWRTLSDLNETELQKLITELIIKRLNENKPEEILGDIYHIDGPITDVKEFSTILNSCGRLAKQAVGIALCLGDKESLTEAYSILNMYKKKIVNAWTWFNNNKNTTNVVENEEYILINAGDNIKDTIIGTFASMLAKSLARDSIIIAMARNAGKTKISVRTTRPTIDLQNFLLTVAPQNTISGGHSEAAGALIPTEKEEEFIANISNFFSQNKINQTVVAPERSKEQDL